MKLTKQEQYRCSFLTMAVTALNINIGEEATTKFLSSLVPPNQIGIFSEKIDNLEDEVLTKNLKFYVEEGVKAILEIEEQGETNE